MSELGDFDGLPDEVNLLIFSYLDTTSKLMLSQTCKKAYSLIHDTKLLSELQKAKVDWGRNLWAAPLRVEGTRAYLKVPLGLFVNKGERDLIKNRVKAKHKVVGVILMNPDEPFATMDPQTAVTHAESIDRPPGSEPTAWAATPGATVGPGGGQPGGTRCWCLPRA
jgi:hypothetical protein